MFDERTVEAVAECLRSLEVEGKKVFEYVNLEKVDYEMWLDLPGVESTLYFPIGYPDVNPDRLAEPVPAPPARRWYCVDCDVIYEATDRALLPCIEGHDVQPLSDVTWKLLLSKYGPSMAGGPRVICIKPGEGILVKPDLTFFKRTPRIPGPPEPVYNWKPIMAMFPGGGAGIAGTIVDSMVGPDNVLEINDIQIHSVSLVSAEQVVHPCLLLETEILLSKARAEHGPYVRKVDGQLPPEGASRQWLVSNGFLPVDTEVDADEVE